MRALKKLGCLGQAAGKGERTADPAHIVVEPAQETDAALKRELEAAKAQLAAAHGRVEELKAQRSAQQREITGLREQVLQAPNLPKRTILVLGATGTAGKEVSRALLAKNTATVRVAVRSVNSEKAKSLSADGAEPVTFDWASTDGWPTALAGCDGVLIVTANMAPTWADDVKALCDAAKKAGLRHVVKLSGLAAIKPGEADPYDFRMGVEHGKSDAMVEQSGLKWTILNCNFFMSNAMAYQGRTIKGEQSAFYGVSAGKPVCYVAPSDIGAVAAEVLIAPDKYYGKAFALSGPPMTDEEMAEAISNDLGKAVSYVDLPADAFRSANVSAGSPEWVVDDLLGLERIKSNGVAGVPSSGIKDVLGREPMTFKEYLQGPISSLTDHETLMSMPLTVVIFGATGDLAKKKLFPALYQLCRHGHLPKTLNVVGYGRSPVDLEAFIAKQCVNIKADASYPRSEFTDRIRFHAGGYEAPESYQSLAEEMREYEAGHAADARRTGGPPADGATVTGNRLYFLSVPPSIFGGVAAMIHEYGRAPAGGFTRLMIEKPFGRDSASFEELNEKTAGCFDESELYRLDHYLGKEVILNIPTLRWANQTFEPIWNAQHIESVQITFKEDLGTGGRGGYFDNVGIIRDIIQNHLLQAFMWLAMEPPASMRAVDIIKAKVELLKKVRTISLGDAPDYNGVFLGQFGRHGHEPGYTEDTTVPSGSNCATFAALFLQVDTPRWRDVPFLFTAAKGMDERVCEVRIRFRPSPSNRMMGVGGEQANELVMRIQPNEALYLISVAKEPGITAEQVRKPVVMDMSYANQFGDAYLGDAYERMFLNAARGDQALFVSSAELFEAWRIFTPLLHAIDEKKPPPVVHPFGYYPRGFTEWTATRGVTIQPTWHEFIALNGDHIEEMKRVFAELDKDGNGMLDHAEMTELARHFYDGRTPDEKRVRAIFDAFDMSDGRERSHTGRVSVAKSGITLDDMIKGAQVMARAFEVAADDHAPKSYEKHMVEPPKMPAEYTDGLARCSTCYIPESWLALPLVSKREYNHDSTIYAFGLPDGQSLCLPVCACILLKAPGKGRKDGGGPDDFDGSDAVRPYTPISDNSMLGQFELVVKRYDGGAVSQYLHALDVGASVEFKHIKFNIKAQYPFEGKTSFTFLCGGSGISPMYQALWKLLGTPGDERKVTLVYSNKTPADILLREELDAYAAKFPERFKLVYTVTRYTADATAPAGWESTPEGKYVCDTGWIDEPKVCGQPGLTPCSRAHMPLARFALRCVLALNAALRVWVRVWCRWSSTPSRRAPTPSSSCAV